MVVNSLTFVTFATFVNKLRVGVIIRVIIKGSFVFMGSDNAIKMEYASR